MSSKEVINSEQSTAQEENQLVIETVPNEWRSEPEYPKKFIIGDPNEGMKTRASSRKSANIALISQLEPKKVEEALKDNKWVDAMKDLDQFEKNQVWKLVPKPENAAIIGTKWIFRNKLNEVGEVVRNKARLVAQG